MSHHEHDDAIHDDHDSTPQTSSSPATHHHEHDDALADELVNPTEELTCAVCGGTISENDLVCPHCGVSLAAG